MPYRTIQSAISTWGKTGHLNLGPIPDSTHIDTEGDHLIYLKLI